MFNGVGHRPRLIQHITLGADHAGRLQGIRHEAHNATAINIDYCETAGGETDKLYACDHVEVKQTVVPLNCMTPSSMCAPGHASGTFSFDLGDNRFPASGVSGGSTVAASVASAVALAGQEVRKKLGRLAVRDRRLPLYGLKLEQLGFADWQVRALDDPTRSEDYAALIGRHGGKPIEGPGKVGAVDVPTGGLLNDTGPAFGAQFAQVRVHATTGEVRVARLCAAFGCGRILNPMTTRSQLAGAMTWGVGQALMEETVEDLRTGRLATKDLADYHVPVQADVPKIEVILLDERDDKINPLGIKGADEIGITGVAAAVANAVYNATGFHVCDLPIAPDKITGQMVQDS